MQRAPQTTAVLDQDAELGERVPGAQRAQAREASVAALRTIARGPWQPAREPRRVSDGFGLLVLDGLLVRDVEIERRHGAEVLGRGDLLRPWDGDGGDALLPITLSWRVLAPLRLAVLDERWALRMSPWPSVACQLTGRGILRARRLVAMLAIVQEPRLDLRLWTLLWELAERYGTVHVDGVHVDVPLTHEALAHLVSARRPSVSSAMGRLIERGVVERRRATWILRGGPPFADG